MRNLLLCFFVPVIAALAGCATTISVSSLSKPENEGDYVTVKRFRYNESKGDASSVGLEEGRYKVEYANEEGYFYRGAGLPVKIPGALNMNKQNYPNSMYQGGLFIPKDVNNKQYRVYYYQNNLPDSPGPGEDAVRQLQMQQNVEPGRTVPSTPAVAGTAIGLGVTNYIVDSGRGQIVLVTPPSDLDVRQFVSRP